MTRRKGKQEAMERGEDLRIETLGHLLDRLAEDGAMRLEELDGFFAALHCSPELVPPSEYLRVVLGQNRKEGGVVFKNAQEAEIFASLVLHHWNSVGRALCEGKAFMPLLWTDEKGKIYGNDWAIGFLRGTELRKNRWIEFMEDDEGLTCLMPIFALAHENDPDPKLRPYKKPVTEDQRDALLAGLSVAVSEIYRLFEPERRREIEIRKDGRESSRQEVPKFRRNDPCYCGSGKKYKKCCGAVKAN